MEMSQAPLFPLPDTILFPGQILPLQIFEPRYRQMTHDLLDGRGELIIGTVLGADQQLLDQVAPVQPVGGLGRLERYEKLDDGRYVIIVLGLERTHVYPLKSELAYPMAEYQSIESDNILEDDLRTRVRELVDAKQDFNSLPEGTGASQLVDILIMTAEIPIEEKYHFYSIGDLPERATQILSAYGDA